jgi:hypothetical protein
MVSAVRLSLTVAAVAVFAAPVNPSGRSYEFFRPSHGSKG